jgi:hypothetical protein
MACMFVRNSTWSRIRDEFTDGEKGELRAAIDGEMICPPGLQVDVDRLRPELAMKLRDAATAVAPGA